MNEIGSVVHVKDLLPKLLSGAAACGYLVTPNFCRRPAGIVSVAIWAQERDGISDRTLTSYMHVCGGRDAVN